MLLVERKLVSSFQHRPLNLSPQDLSHKPRPPPEGARPGSGLIKPEAKPPSLPVPPHVGAKLDFPPGFAQFPLKDMLPKPGAPVASAAMAPGVKVEPNFNLFGYPGATQKFLPQDKVATGFKTEDAHARTAKSEPKDAKRSHAPPPAHAPVKSDVKMEAKASDVKPALGGSISQGTSRAPAAAGEHSNARSSAASNAHAPHSSDSARSVVPPPGLPHSFQNLSPAQMMSMQHMMASIMNPAAYAQFLKNAQTLPPGPLPDNKPPSAPAKNHSPNAQKRRAPTPASSSAAPAVPSKSEPVQSNAKKARVEEQAPAAASAPKPPAAAPAAQQSQGESFVGSFKTFIENTVTRQYHQEFKPVKANSDTSNPAPQQQLPQKPAPVTSASDRTAVSAAQTTVASKPAAGKALDSLSVASNNSVQETIDRAVTNGGLDTDSDTLSANSPSSASGTRSMSDGLSPARAPRCHKKAMLQRYAEEKPPAATNNCVSEERNRSASASPATFTSDARLASQAEASAQKFAAAALASVTSADDAMTSASDAESHDGAQKQTSKKRASKSKKAPSRAKTSKTTPKHSKEHASDVDSGHDSAAASPGGAKRKKSKQTQPAFSDTEMTSHNSSSEAPPSKKKKKGESKILPL